MADTYFNPTVIVMIVEDNPNVLSRISLMFGQRGFNIDTITASHTHDQKFTRITITTHGDQTVIDRIVRQTQKLVEVHKVEVQTAGTHIERELILVKVEVKDDQRSQIREICEIYHGTIVEMTRTSMILEMTGKPPRIDAFLEVLEPYPIIEMTRTGVTAIDRGPDPLSYDKTRTYA